MSGWNYLIFHTVVEFASIAIAWGIFMMAWPARRFMEHDYVLFLGFAYLAVGALDLMHTVTYKGMGVWSADDPNIPTQLWVAARYLEAAALLAAPTFARHRLPTLPAALGTAVVTLGVLYLILGTHLFPSCYVEGVGLTPFKVVSEYVIVGLLGVAIYRLRVAREAFDRRLFTLMVASLVLTVLAEAAFTTYVSVYGPTNQIGHFLKLGSFLCVYLGVIHNGLRHPYEVLFRDLYASEEALRSKNRELEAEIAQRERTEAGLRKLTNDLTEARLQAEKQLEAAETMRRDLVRRISEAALRKADTVQHQARLTRAVDELRRENQVLTEQLAGYVRMFEQAHYDADSLLTSP